MTRPSRSDSRCSLPVRSMSLAPPVADQRILLSYLGICKRIIRPLVSPRPHLECLAGMLSEAQKQAFRDEGYICPLTAMDEAAAARTLAALQRFEAAHDGFGQRLRFKAHLRLAALME